MVRCKRCSEEDGRSDYVCYRCERRYCFWDKEQPLLIGFGENEQTLIVDRVCVDCYLAGPDEKERANETWIASNQVRLLLKNKLNLNQ